MTNTSMPHIYNKKNYFNTLVKLSGKKVNIEYFVYKNIKKENSDPRCLPSNWFNYYGKNIGIEGKQDDNHMFPFEFDHIIHKCACKETKINDKYSEDKVGIQLYFDGYVKYDNVLINGTYEYFITHGGILFHRLFVSS